MSDEQSIFDYLGGEPTLRSLCARFYMLMDELPQAQGIRAMHGDLEAAQEKLFLFLCGWFGGPNYYIERYGHPRLRARHLPFKIDPAAKEAWMMCMRIALAEHVPNKAVRQQIEDVFNRMAIHMQNTQAPHNS